MSSGAISSAPARRSFATRSGGGWKGLDSLRDASLASLALRTDWSVDAACSLMYQFAMAKEQQRLAPPTPPPGVPPPILTQPIIKITTGASGEGSDEALSAAAAAQSLTPTERACVKRLAAFAAIEDNKGVDEIAKYIDGASSAGAPSPHIMRLVHATDAYTDTTRLTLTPTLTLTLTL